MLQFVVDRLSVAITQSMLLERVRAQAKQEAALDSNVWEVADIDREPYFARSRQPLKPLKFAAYSSFVYN